MMTPEQEHEPAPAPAAPKATSKKPGSAPAKSTGRLGTAVVMLVLGLAVGRFACTPDAQPSAHGTHGEGTATAAAQAEVWTCSMHPQIRMPEPGQCPICSMDLILVQTSDDEGLNPSMLRMSDNAMALAEIQTQAVERRTVNREIRMVGRVAIDETLLSYITAWVPSRLDRLFVDYTGVNVRAGDHMVEVYSPNLIATQQELLQAVKTQELLKDSPVDVLRSRQSESVNSAKERLRLWGLSPSQISDIIERGEPLEHVTINSPASGVVIHKNALQGDYVETGTRIYTIADLSRVWVTLEAYESDLAWLHYGQQVDLVSEAWPGESFSGRINFINPVLNNKTRTIKVRLNVDNSDGRLKPDMFMRATVNAPMSSSGTMLDSELADMWMCPMHPEIIQQSAGQCSICGMDLAPTGELGFGQGEETDLPLVIPATAPLVTGRRAVVYVRDPDAETPSFEGREIELGPRAGDWYVVSEGLKEGELVVVQGAFKLDSELQIRAKPSMMSPEGGVPAPGHQHDVPEVFRVQLGAALPAYLSVQEALAADDSVTVAAASATFLRALGAIDMAALTGSTHLAWMSDSAPLLKAAGRLAKASDIEAQRLALRDVTAPFLRALESYGYSADSEPVAVFHCPMAFGDGADWIQAGEQTSNPYYGTSMLSCGDRIRPVSKER